MRSAEPSTFILNRNDVEYYFVEGKSNSKNGPVYYFYHDKNESPLRFSVESFIEIFGIDEKIAISKFVKQALIDLTLLYGTDSEIDFVYDKLHIIYSKIEGSSDMKKPSLGKYKKDLIEVLSMYNQIKELLPRDPEIPYIENYDLVMEEEVIYEEVCDRNEVVNFRQNDISELSLGGVQRRLKYDN